MNKEELIKVIFEQKFQLGNNVIILHKKGVDLTDGLQEKFNKCLGDINYTGTITSYRVKDDIVRLNLNNILIDFGSSDNLTGNWFIVFIGCNPCEELVKFMDYNKYKFIRGG